MSRMHPEPENICALVIAYHPDAGLPDRIRLATSQVSRVIVVDNGSPRDAVHMLQHVAAEFQIHFILNPDNRGVATALNQGIEWALAQGYAWVLALDQDTVVDQDMVHGLLEVYDQLAEKSDIGIIAPNYRGQHAKSWKKLASEKSIWVERRDVITSGSLISMQAFCETGKFRDDFFIDLVDTEYCLRLRSHGYAIYMATRPLMTHAVGAQTRHRMIRGGVIASNHSALRRYYIARNRLVLAGIYLWREPKVVLRECMNMLIELGVIVLYESNKKDKLHAIFIGFLDAVSGRMGKQTRRSGPGE